MINAIIYRNKGYINRYTVEGHANYDKYGRDIVCAAVSILTQNTLLSLNRVIGIKDSDIDYSIDHDIGFIDVIIKDTIPDEKMDEAQILLESLVVGLNSIEKSYPKYIAIKNRGV